MHLYLNIDEFEKSEISKNRSLAGNTWYDWYEWLIDHIPNSVQKSAGFVKEKLMRLFRSRM